MGLVLLAAAGSQCKVATTVDDIDPKLWELWYLYLLWVMQDSYHQPEQGSFAALPALITFLS